ncbi:MAG: hypothetical protein UZ06_CHB003000625 [Chlorobi bacterium OLB6]|nr:MAG: hypothetical protein UZ06_CHB003000625 [Chlorobi bacterium OLB6]
MEHNIVTQPNSHRFAGSLPYTILMPLAGAVAITLASQVRIDLPGTPVPITGQTFAVLVWGLFVWRTTGVSGCSDLFVCRGDGGTGLRRVHLTTCFMGSYGRVPSWLSSRCLAGRYSCRKPVGVISPINCGRADWPHTDFTYWSPGHADVYWMAIHPDNGCSSLPPWRHNQEYGCRCCCCWSTKGKSWSLTDIKCAYWQL